MKEPPTITAKELLEHLKGIPPEAEISFSGLSFYRIKQRAPLRFQIEFDQTVYLDESGRVVVENPE